MTTTAQQMRDWSGPTILTYGFRPFFFGAALWAAFSMALWIPMLTGTIGLPTAFDPVSWHAHEFLFGYLTAVVAGFLLTAAPNWTGRLPIVGWRLGALAALWVAGRIAVGVSVQVPALAVALVDLAMPVALGAVIAREIVAGKNWRNLMVLAMLVALAIGNAVFHWEAARGDFAAQGYGLRIGLSAGLIMVAVIGGRIVPSFTRNWLVKHAPGALPSPPMQGFDKLVLFVLLLALIFWIAVPQALLTAAALFAAGLLHLVRLARWAGHRTGAEPLVAVLHIAYAFLPLGALAVAAEIALPGLAGLGAVQHLWMGGALGLMTLAVMTRATLGHTGQALAAGGGTVAIYLSLMLAVLARVAAGFLSGFAPTLYSLSGLFWIAAFGMYLWLYGPLLLRARPSKTG